MGHEMIPFALKISAIICLTTMTFVLIYKRASPLDDATMLPGQETALRKKHPAPKKDKPLYTNYSMVSLLLDTQGLNLFEEGGSDDEFALKLRDLDPFVPYCTFAATGVEHFTCTHLQAMKLRKN